MPLPNILKALFLPVRDYKFFAPLPSFWAFLAPNFAKRKACWAILTPVPNAPRAKAG